MCGFVLAAGENIKNNWVGNGINLLKHRGPDYTGFYTGINFECAHSRLAIIDLDPRSNQPMVSEKGVILLFNGEIFNYLDLRNDLESKGSVFKTNSDTEVIINGFILEGKEFIKKLNGQFSIALITNELIYLFRDPSGQKPIYFSLNNNTLYVASEVSPFYSFNESLNENFITDYLENGYSKTSPFKNIEKLSQGTSLEYDRKNHKIKKYKFHEHYINKELVLDSRNNIKLKLIDEIKASINRHCLADVPIGLLLSGGIDSSLIASFISDRKNITCFTVDFGDNQNEIENAKSISNFFELKLEILSIKDSLSFKEYREIIETMKEPIGDSSYLAVYLISKKIKEKGIKVVLTGDGADELFAGYSLYRNLKLIYKTPSIIKYCIYIFIKLIGLKNRKILKWANACETLLNNTHPNLRSFFNEIEIYKLTRLRKNNKSSPKFSNNYVKEFMRLDITSYLSEGLLFKNDCASMCNSVEFRAPFLDKEIVNFSLQKLPEKELLKNNKMKSLLIEIAEKRFPESYSFDRKRGFNFANSIVNENFNRDAINYINSKLSGDESLINLLNLNLTNGNSWDFYKFHLLFTLKNYIYKYEQK